jgi:hypothetical protein
VAVVSGQCQWSAVSGEFSIPPSFPNEHWSLLPDVPVEELAAANALRRGGGWLVEESIPRPPPMNHSYRSLIRATGRHAVLMC